MSIRDYYKEQNIKKFCCGGKTKDLNEFYSIIVYLIESFEKKEIENFNYDINVEYF